MPDVHHVETTTHGRVLVERAARGGTPACCLVAFHGYGQNAEDILAEVTKIPGADRGDVAAVQALHRFYSRGDERVIASWMTRQDRELAIADNITYVNRALDEVVLAGADTMGVVFVGFSQGVAMAYRAAAFGSHRAAGVIALGGDVPPDVFEAKGVRLPPVLIGAGDAEKWYTASKADADAKGLAARGVTHEVIRYRGGHEWTAEFREAAGRWLGVRS